MDQFSNVILAVDTVHTVPQWTLGCGLGLGGLNQQVLPLCTSIVTHQFNRPLIIVGFQ